MKLKFKIDKIIVLVIAILCANFTLIAQSGYEKILLNYFNKQSYLGKINTIDTLSGSSKLRYYHFVESELQKIKQQAISDNKVEVLDQLTKIDAEMYFLNKNYYKCIPMLLDLLARHKIKNYKDSSNVFFQLKNSYINTRSIYKAIEIHKLLVTLTEKYPKIDAWLLTPELSSIYYEIKSYKEALHQQTLEYQNIKNNPDRLLAYYNNRGLFWSKYNNQDSAIACYTIAKQIFYKNHDSKKLMPNDEFTIGLIDGNIGQSLMLLKKYEPAIPLLKKDVCSSVNFHNFHNAAISQLELSRCYLSLNKLELSKNYLDSAALFIKSIDDYKIKLSIIKQYAVYYNKIGAHSTAIDYYKSYIVTKDSLDEKENLKELISTQVAYQMDEKEKLIEVSQLKVQQKNSEIERATGVRNLLILGGFLLIITIVFILYQLKRSNEQKNQLEINNAEIEAKNNIINKSLLDKDLLIKEVHHRVKNNLQIVSSLLKLQSGKSNNDEVKTSLQEAEDRINSMALLHQLLYRNNEMSSVWFNNYLTSLINQITSSFSAKDNRIEITWDIIDLELDLDRAIPLGLITNELLSNAFKHAFDNNTGMITVELVNTVKNTYKLSVFDNGKGLPENFDIHKLESLGLDIVSILSEQINAELSIYNDNGAHFEITFIY